MSRFLHKCLCLYACACLLHSSFACGLDDWLVVCCVVVKEFGRRSLGFWGEISLAQAIPQAIIGPISPLLVPRKNLGSRIFRSFCE